MQLIYKFKEVFLDANLPLYLRPYEIIVLNESSGILEFVTNSISIDGLKKSFENYNNLLDFYKDMFGDKLPDFQTNFVNSLAASSLLTYILQVKDRHNGNILIDSDGHIVHIDFGFIFCISPGGLNF
jgi:phosphatidylinositol kinase/protein kinase (PI-3  family)